MNKNEYVDSKIALYSDAFDFYMDCGQMLDLLPNGDLLGGYIKSVIDSNPQLNSQDPTWKDVLKDDLLTFLASLIEAFYPIEQEYEKELTFIDQYQEADIEKQRSLWPVVFKHVKGVYASTDVNIEGYIELFKENDVQDVINSLSNDWRKACEKKMITREECLLQQNKDKWERHIREWGRTDYERRKKIDKLFHHYPLLQEIVRIIGREQPQRSDDKDDIVYKYIPMLLSTNTTSTEVEQITVGNDLSHVIPNEIATLSEPETETLFFKKYAEGQLQIFTNKPPMKAQCKEEEKYQRKPRLEMGPIIISMDTSGSMNGMPEKIARCLLTQLLRIAKKKHRKCFVITFSVRAKTLELTKPANWRLVKNFLEKEFSGGTDGEEMLSAALSALGTKHFYMADILIISDFEFPIPKESTSNRMKIAHTKGTRFYGLQIGKWNNQYDKILDKMWKIEL